MSMTRWTAAVGRLPASSSKFTRTYPMCPSREICDAPVGANGLVTDATWGSGARAAASSEVRARFAGSVKLPVVVTTTWAGLPEKAGNSASRICCAVWVPPDRLLEKLLPAAWAATLTATRNTIHVTSTHQRWSWHQPATRANALCSAGRDGGTASAAAGGRRSVVVTPILRVAGAVRLDEVATVLPGGSRPSDGCRRRRRDSTGVPMLRTRP